MAGPSLAAPLPAGLDGYLAEFADRLRGPRRSRAALIAEVRDGLLAATERRVAAGMPPERAAADALAEFGTPAGFARGFDGELGVASARWAVLAFLGTGPLVGACWLFLLHRDGLPLDPLQLAGDIPALPLVAAGVIACGLVVATTGRLTRWLPAASPQAALGVAASVAALSAAIDLTMLTVLATTVLIGHGVASAPMAALAAAASLTRLAAAGWIGWRCLRHRRTLTGRARRL